MLYRCLFFFLSLLYNLLNELNPIDVNEGEMKTKLIRIRNEWNWIESEFEMRSNQKKELKEFWNEQYLCRQPFELTSKDMSIMFGLINCGHWYSHKYITLLQQSDKHHGFDHDYISKRLVVETIDENKKQLKKNWNQLRIHDLILLLFYSAWC